MIKELTLAIFFSLIFVYKMSVFVSRPMKIATFLLKNGDSAKRVVDFPRERDTFRNKIMEIVKDFDEKSYNNNGEPRKSSRIFRVKPNSFIFLFSSFFYIFSFFFFSFFIFIFKKIFVFRFFNFSFFNFSFFFHLLSSSFIFFHFLFLCWVLKICFLFGLNFVTISLDSSDEKNNLWAHLWGVILPLWAPLFLFFLLFFSVFVFFLLFIFSHFCLFLHFLIS